jgi:hypothetical protein
MFAVLLTRGNKHPAGIREPTEFLFSRLRFESLLLFVSMF